MLQISNGEVPANTVVLSVQQRFPIRVVPSSNIGPETGRPEAFNYIQYSPQGHAGILPQNRPRPLTSTHFPIHNHPDIRRHIT
jgi:hypothetical protein